MKGQFSTPVRKVIAETTPRQRMMGALSDTLVRAKRAQQGNPSRAFEILSEGLANVLAENERNKGFSSLGEQLKAVAEASRESSVVDPRLVRAPTGMNEGDGAAGGFLIQDNFTLELARLAYEEAVLAPLCDRRETSNPLAAVKVPAIDETSRAEGSRLGGTTSYWAAEAETVAPNFPKFRNIEFSAKKLIALCRTSSEIFADAPMFDAHIKRAYAAEAGFQVDKSILLGSGAGQLLGVVNAPCAISIAKETGQAAGTIVAENIRKMWSRLPAPSRRRAVWIINEDGEEQLEQLATVIGTGGMPASAPLYMPQGVNGVPFPLLKGRPVLVVEQAPALGTLGDIVLGDFGHYILVDGGMKPMMSVHARFLNDEIVWRFILRVDGQPSFSSPITPFNGTVTRSPFVTLAARG